MVLKIPVVHVELVPVKFILPHKLVGVCNLHFIFDWNASGILCFTAVAHLLFQSCRLFCRLDCHGPPPKLMS